MCGRVADASKLPLTLWRYRRGSKRKAAAEAAFNSVGAKVESLYFTFGDEDVVAIVDGPDNATMAAASFAINASGAVTLKTTVLSAKMP